MVCGLLRFRASNLRAFAAFVSEKITSFDGSLKRHLPEEKKKKKKLRERGSGSRLHLRNSAKLCREVELLSIWIVWDFRRSLCQILVNDPRGIRKSTADFVIFKLEIPVGVRIHHYDVLAPSDRLSQRGHWRMNGCLVKSVTKLEGTQHASSSFFPLSAVFSSGKLWTDRRLQVEINCINPANNNKKMTGAGCAALTVIRRV